MNAATVESRTTALVRAHQTEIWRYVRFLGATATEAEDLTQETFLAVLQRPFEDRGPIHTAAYLRTVARNLLLKTRARSARETVALDAAATERIWRQTCMRDGGDAHVRALRECVETLDGRGREVISRRYAQGQSRSQIAAELDLSVDGVKSMLRRLRSILRSCVERRQS